MNTLLNWAEGDLKEKAELAFKGLGEYACGEWCRFCKAKAICRKRADALLERRLLLRQFAEAYNGLGDCNAADDPQSDYSFRRYAYYGLTEHDHAFSRVEQLHAHTAISSGHGERQYRYKDLQYHCQLDAPEKPCQSGSQFHHCGAGRRRLAGQGSLRSGNDRRRENGHVNDRQYARSYSRAFVGHGNCRRGGGAYASGCVGHVQGRLRIGKQLQVSDERRQHGSRDYGLRRRAYAHHYALGQYRFKGQWNGAQQYAAVHYVLFL